MALLLVGGGWARSAQTCPLSAEPALPPCRNLSGNPLECDCGLAWLPRWAEERRVRLLRPEAATCAGPGPLAGQPLLSVPLLDGSCGECRRGGPGSGAGERGRGALGTDAREG